MKKKTIKIVLFVVLGGIIALNIYGLAKIIYLKYCYDHRINFGPVKASANELTPDVFDATDTEELIINGKLEQPTLSVSFDDEVPTVVALKKRVF